MAVSSDYVAAIRQRLRLTTDDFDNELTDLINAARADLALGGVVEEKANDETDPLILKAVETYVKAEFGLDNEDADRYRASYKEQRNSLTLPSFSSACMKTDAMSRVSGRKPRAFASKSPLTARTRTRAKP